MTTHGFVIVSYRLSPSHKLPPSIPNLKIARIKKIASARVTMERGKDSEHSKLLKSSPSSAINREPQILPENPMLYGRGLCRLFPLPVVARALSFFPLRSLRTTQRGLWGGESGIELCLPGECYRWCIGAIRVLNKQIKVNTLGIQNMHTKCSDCNQRLHVTSTKRNERLFLYSR